MKKKVNNHFSRAFLTWYNSFLKENNLKREQIWGDKKKDWNVFKEEVVLFDIHTMYEAFKAGQNSK